MQNYKDLKVWVKAHLFTLLMYQEKKSFPKEELYCLTSQLRRSATSVPANIAEGCGKKTNPELAHYLNIALGSSNESEYYLLLSKDLKYLSDEKYIALNLLINEVKARLIALINKVCS
ncbi:MAG: four helix bundle protein [Chitinophagaceae bacterium]|nr:MAG: four helix bundle protein [Chitinophagaceae bacterium]